MRTLNGTAALIASVVGIAQAATCWYPDGKTQESNHAPCNSTIPDSACCDPADACSESGICLGRTGFNYRGENCHMHLQNIEIDLSRLLHRSVLEISKLPLTMS